MRSLGKRVRGKLLQGFESLSLRQSIMEEYIESKYFSYADPDDSWLRQIIIRSIESIAGQPALFKLYREYQENPSKWDSFWHGCVDQLKLDLNFNKENEIPSNEPVIFVANHPYGVLDGLVISYFVSQYRKDFKVLTHSMLLRAPETKGYLLPIDFTGDKQALLTNLQTRKDARKHLSEGGSIIIFPSGTVSTTLKFYQHADKAFDCEWKKFTSRLIKQTNPKIVPIYFYGQNSILFHLASHISDMLRASLIFNEVRRRIGTEVKFKVGKPFYYSDLDGDLSNQDLANFLRSETYLLNPEISVPPPYGLDV